MVTTEILLRRRADVLPEQFDALVAEEVTRIRRALPMAGIRHARNVITHRDEALVAGESLVAFDEVVRLGGLPPAYARVPLDSFDAVIEVRVPRDVDPQAVVASFDGLATRIGDPLDAAESCVAMGVEHTIIAGAGAVSLFYCFRRGASVTHDDFIDYWRNTLIKHTTKTPAKTGYVQLHVDPALSALGARAAGVAIDDFDGVALEWYPDMSGFMTAVSWASEPDAAIIESESSINDFVSSRSMVAYAQSAEMVRS